MAIWCAQASRFTVVPPSDSAANPMKPVVQLSVRVIQTHTVPAGTLVGYGGSHRAASEMRLATLAAGYADGLPSSLSDRGAAFAIGKRLPIIGRVSMDSMTIDISSLPEGALGLGSLVELIGAGPNAGRYRRRCRNDLLRNTHWTRPALSSPIHLTKSIHNRGNHESDILGAGVIGVTSAYYLAKAGHQVTVIDRQTGPALETSFANAGEVSFGYCSPWAAPGIPQKALKWLFMEHAPLILRPKVDYAMLSWMVRMLANCTSERYAVNKSRMLRLADYSRQSLAELRGESNIAYDERMQGTLQLFRTQAQLDASAKDVKALAADGIPYEVLDREGCIRIEPALRHVSDKIVGGLLTPKDETGDCFKFTNAWQPRARAMGVTFDYGRTIKGIEVEAGQAKGVVTERGTVASDAIVVALGSYSPLLLKPLGIKPACLPRQGLLSDHPDRRCFAGS
jgi:glycine/D-amino acid oxidase-like deaminating enzyme